MTYYNYLSRLGKSFTKLARLDFLNPDGAIAFSVSSDSRNPRSKALLQEGTLNVALNNGRRRQATVVLDNSSGEFSYAVNHLWFGQTIALYEGLRMPDGSDYLLPQGVFVVENPEEILQPDGHTVRLQLADKWALLDGSMGGRLDGDYLVEAGANIFDAMASLLKLDRFTGEPNGTNPIDSVTLIFTQYFNGRTQTLSDGTVVSLTSVPHDIVTDAGGTLADVLLNLASMLGARIGYDACGRLRVDPSSDDLDEGSKPVQFAFSMHSPQLLGLHYTANNTQVYNDCIVVGAADALGYVPRARAQNRDPKSSTCVSRIGLKTIRYEMSNYYTEEQCRAYAEWMLKRAAVPVSSLELQCSQMFHITGNGIITVQREAGETAERHIVQSFTRPLNADGAMTIQCVSAGDFPQITILETDTTATATNPAEEN